MDEHRQPSRRPLDQQVERAQQAADRALGLLLEELDALQPADRVDGLLRLIVAHGSRALECVERLLDVLDARPKAALTILLSRLGALFGSAHLPMSADVAAGHEAITRRALMRQASRGVWAVAVPGSPTVLLESEDQQCRPLDLAPAEEDLFAILLEDHGLDRYGLAAWRAVEEVQRALKLRAKARRVGRRTVGPRQVGTAAPLLGVRSNAKEASTGRVAGDGGGRFSMSVLRLRKAIERAGGNPWWVQRQPGCIRLALRRNLVVGDLGPVAPSLGTDR